MEQSTIDNLVEKTEEERKSLLNIRQYIHHNYGIFFKDCKLYSLENKIKKRLRFLPIQTLNEYETYLKNNPDEVPHFLDEVSTNKTAFFREIKHWEYLVEKLIPEWKNRPATIKAWSVACSTGEEPYTLAMLLNDHLCSNAENYREDTYKILASDISRQVLQATEEGSYPRERLNQVEQFDPEYVDEFFKRESSSYKISPRLKKKMTLRRFNLSNEEYPFKNTFDLILCRNVMIYFDEAMIEHVIDRLTGCLKPRGYLFIGHTESLHEIEHSLTKIKPAIFRKR